MRSFQAVPNRSMARLGWQGRFQSSLAYPSYIGWHIVLDASALSGQTTARSTPVHSI